MSTTHTHLLGVEALALGPPLAPTLVQQLQVGYAANAAVADEILDDGDGRLLGPSVLVARAQLPASGFPAGVNKRTGAHASECPRTLFTRAQL